MSTPLDATQITAALATLPGWTAVGTAIQRQYAAGSFADAVALLTRLAFEAESVDQHPDFVLEYRRLTVQEMQQQAAALGANAIIGVDLDYETIGQGGSMLMVSASGTAVVI